MNVQYLKLNPLPGYRNWVYDIQEIASGVAEVKMYRDGVLRFSSPLASPIDRMLPTLSEAAARMEFDIQRKISRRLYGYEIIKGGGGIFADMANSNVRSFLARHAMPLKQLGFLDSGIKLEDVSGFLDVVREERLQILAIKSFEMKQGSVVSCREIWRSDDMSSPTISLLHKNLVVVSGVFSKERKVQCARRMYSFVIDSRIVVPIGE